MDQATAVATAIATLTFAALPAIGQPLDAGKFVGLTTTADGKHCAVVLLDDKPSKRLNWDDAKAWADSVGGTLPSRPVGALLFANARSSCEPNWHWTCEEYEHDGSYAWFQYFFGFQSYNVKSYEARARAVRLIHISA
jgi:hypothetical protein